MAIVRCPACGERLRLTDKKLLPRHGSPNRCAASRKPLDQAANAIRTLRVSNLPAETRRGSPNRQVIKVAGIVRCSKCRAALDISTRGVISEHRGRDGSICPKSGEISRVRGLNASARKVEPATQKDRRSSPARSLAQQVSSMRSDGKRSCAICGQRLRPLVNDFEASYSAHFDDIRNRWCPLGKRPSAAAKERQEARRRRQIEGRSTSVYAYSAGLPGMGRRH